jgi:hypothetical protein
MQTDHRWTATSSTRPAPTPLKLHTRAIELLTFKGVAITTVRNLEKIITTIAFGGGGGGGPQGRRQGGSPPTWRRSKPANPLTSAAHDKRLGPDYSIRPLQQSSSERDEHASRLSTDAAKIFRVACSIIKNGGKSS